MEKNNEKKENMNGLVWVDEKVWTIGQLQTKTFTGSKKEVIKLYNYLVWVNNGFFRIGSGSYDMLLLNNYNAVTVWYDKFYALSYHGDKAILISDIVFDKKWEQDYEFNLAADENNALLQTFEDIVYHYKPTNEVKEVTNQGYKDTANKLLVYELDASFIKEMAKVMSSNKVQNNGKYEAGNHYKPINPVELLSSLERHFLEIKEYFQAGNIKDLIDDDGCSHITKIATNSMMVWIQLNKVKNE